MAFKKRITDTVDFNSLLVSLNNTGLQQKSPALYQTLKLLIEKSAQKQNIDRSIFRSIIGDVEVLDLPFDLTSIVENIQLLLNATYVTAEDETADLVDSRVLTAGTNITIDLTTPGQIIISSSGGGSGDFVTVSPGGEPGVPLTDGAGNFLYIQYNP